MTSAFHQAIALACALAQEEFPGLTAEQLIASMRQAIKPSATVARDPCLYTVNEVGALLKVTPRTVHNLLKNNYLVRSKIGRCTRVSRASVEAYLSRSRQGGGLS